MSQTNRGRCHISGQHMLKFLLDERVEHLGLVSVSHTGGIVYCNSTFEAILGYEPGKWHPSVKQMVSTGNHAGLCCAV